MVRKKRKRGLEVEKKYSTDTFESDKMGQCSG